MQPDNSQYDFFMNQQPQKKSKLPLPLPGGGMNKKSLIILGVGGILLLTILITVISMIFGGGPDNKQQLLGVVAQQNEIIRISDLAVKDAKGSEARNLAQTTVLSLRSDQTSLTAALKSQKVKVGSKELQATKSSQTDRELEDAMQNNRFDEEYLEYIQAELVDYQKNLKAVFDTTTSKALRDTLRIQYQNASTLIQENPEI